MSAPQPKKIRISLPAGWREAPAREGVEYVALGPLQQGLQTNLVVTREVAADPSVEKFAERILVGLKRALTNYSLVKQFPVKLGSHQGYLREHLFTSRGRQVSQLQFYVLSGNFAVTITMTCPSSTAFENRSVAEKVFSTFSLE
jgi:hypothetical protein